MYSFAWICGLVLFIIGIVMLAKIIITQTFSVVFSMLGCDDDDSDE